LSTELERMKEEFLKCKDDPIYFISNYIKVIHPLRGLVPFTLYPFQKKVLTEFQNHRFNILRKFRQAGCTTITCAYALWLVTFHRYKTVAVLSIGDAESTEFLDKVKIMYDELPPWLQAGIIERNKHTLKLKTKSLIKSRPSGKASGRSLAGSLLIIDEAAFIENIDELWKAAYPILSTGGKAIVLSTVNGIGNWYHRTYKKAIQGLNKFNAIDIQWEDHPEYHYDPQFDHLYEELEGLGDPPHKGAESIKEWEEITRHNIGYKEWLQEYLCEFLGTGDTYVEGSILRNMYDAVDPEFFTKYNNRMRVWEVPQPDTEYMISIDTGLGREYDHSAAHVINLKTGNQAAEFYSNKTPVNEFASILVNEGALYNTAYLVPERNTIGLNLIEWLFDIYEYENVWMDPDDSKLGIQVTMIKRENVLAKMEEYVRTNVFKINSKRTVEELLTFIINDQHKAVADEGCTDDLVMSLALGAYALDKLLTTTPFEMEKIPHKETNMLAPSRVVNNKG